MTKNDDNRQRIGDAALRLFGDRGYAKTSIGDIAKEAGLLKGNLSYYFKTKAEMLEWVTEARKEELFGRINADLQPDASAPECLTQFLNAVERSAPELARVGCPVGTLCSELSKDDPDLQPYAARILEGLHVWLTQQFGRLVPEQEAQAHAEYLLALAQGAALLAHAYRDPAVVLRQIAHARLWLQTIVAGTEAHDDKK
ncbi:MAG: helix-turn-helix domain-containing protein [Pseudomonadota bacterium]